MTAQILLAASEAQLVAATRWRDSGLMRLECRYLNGAGYDTLAGHRCVCLHPSLAPLVAAYAAEVKTVPEPIPEGLSDEEAVKWVKKTAYDAQWDTIAEELRGRVVTEPSPPFSSPQPGLQAPSSPASTSTAAGDEPPEERSGTHQSDADGEGPPAFDPDEDFSAASYAPQRGGWEGVETPHMGAPADLWGHDDHLPILPPECLPDALAAYVMDEAETMGCDPGMLGLYCIAICAGATTDEIRVQVKAASDRWLESPRLWLMIVGDSGLTMKTPSLDAAIAHAWAIERTMRLAGAEAIKQHEIDRQIYEAQKAEYVKLRSKGEPATLPVEPPPPLAERLIIGNATMEAIADVLLSQGERGALVRQDELLGFIRGAAGGQYKSGKGSDRQDALELANGGPHPIDRKGRTVLIKNWGVSIVGGVQPEMIARVGDDLEHDGLLQRFSVYLPRYYVEGKDRPSDRAALQRYRDVLDRLIKLTPQPDLSPVRFSPEAALIVEDARKWISDTVRGSWLPSGLRSHLAKWPAMLARYCAVYAAIEAADEHHAAVQPVISDHIAAQVWRMMHDCLWAHAKHFYLSTLSGAGDKHALRQIAGLILSEGWTEITTRQMHQRSSVYSAAREPERRAIVTALSELGWLHPIGGKSSITGLPTKFLVNAQVHERFAEIAAQERKQRGDRTLKWDEARAAKKAAREPGSDD